MPDGVKLAINSKCAVFVFNSKFPKIRYKYCQSVGESPEITNLRVVRLVWINGWPLSTNRMYLWAVSQSADLKTDSKIPARNLEEAQNHEISTNQKTFNDKSTDSPQTGERKSRLH